LIGILKLNFCIVVFYDKHITFKGDFYD
jgi:hypothetical protein